VNDIGARASADADSVVAEIANDGGHAVASDASATWDGAAQIVETAIDAFGGIDIVVNNATAGGNDDLWRFPEVEWDLAIDVNLKGYFAMIREVTPHMAYRGGGAIVNTSSASGFGHPSHSAYAAAKEGLVGLTRTAAMELGRFGIRCNAIRPYAITPQVDEYNRRTRRWRRLMDLTMGTRGAAVDREYLAPAKVAPFVVWLCTDAASNINGRSFQVFGDKVSLLSEPSPEATIKCRGGFTLDVLDGVAPHDLVGGLSNRFALSDHPDMRTLEDLGVGRETG
jgi:NAD(P)-dependent dehydrogenase (short-subunit alcohol dehydrogenase family)